MTHRGQSVALELSLPRERTLLRERPVIMGILNITPDSFSDGGRYLEVDAAVEQARRMLEEGADVIDVGGESSRPGAGRVSAQQQKLRVVPVIEAIACRLPESVVSIDTTRVAVAEAALDAGASIINDISAGRDEPEMFELAASRQAPLVLMHMQGEPATMQTAPSYNDVVAEVESFLLERAAAAQSAGVAKRQVILDPGIGFGKTTEHNLSLLAALDRFVATGHPVLLGASRKRFMGAICTPPGSPGSPGGGTPPAPRELLGATCATTALGVAAGATLFRVHDVKPNRQAADVAWALRRRVGR